LSIFSEKGQRFREIRVAHRRGKRRTQEKTGMGAALEKTNGSHKVWGHFREGKNRAAGRLLRVPEGEEDDQRVEGGAE
jgi:hypothetical protein